VANHISYSFEYDIQACSAKLYNAGNMREKIEELVTSIAENFEASKLTVYLLKGMEKITLAMAGMMITPMTSDDKSANVYCQAATNEKIFA